MKPSEYMKALWYATINASKYSTACKNCRRLLRIVSTARHGGLKLTVDATKHSTVLYIINEITVS